MPHSTLKLLPGVDQNRTITLNEAAISTTQLVRFVPDKQGLGLVQKLGGWTRYFSTSVGSIVRALWAWQDTNNIDYLAVGSQARTSTITSATRSGSTATIVYSGSNIYNVGDTIVTTGLSNSALNGTFTVTTSSPGQITFTTSTSGAISNSAPGTLYAGDGLSVIQGASREIITPRSQLFNVAVAADTQLGSPFVTLTATASNIDDFDVVYIQTPISVGGLVLFGLYPTIFVDGTDNFQVVAKDIAGSDILATATVTNGGAVPNYSVTSGQSLVTVTLNDHGFIVGDVYTAVISTTVGGVTIYGNYAVTSLISNNQFQINAANEATSTTSAFMNSGNARYLFYKLPGNLPAAIGYAINTYGDGGYGTGVVPSSVNEGAPIQSIDWTIDNWGQVLISCPVGGPIFTWDPTTGAVQSGIIANGPPVNDGMFVAMPQRQIIAWGSTFNGIQDQLLIRWCDVDNYDEWTASITNQAGSYRLPKGSRIVGCIQGPQQGLVWTDLGVWAMQYVGPPYVYQFNEIGNGCGLIARKAATSMNGVIYWMGQSQFYRLAGSGVEIIQCPVWDVIFQELDETNLDNIRVAANSRFGEISWYFPTISGNGEPTMYVKYNVALNQWDFGMLTRTAWINQSVLGPPIGAGPTIPADEENFIYQHETSTDADGEPMVSSFQTGYFSMDEGEYKVFVDQVWPDMKWGYYGGSEDADLNLTFFVADYPTQTPIAYGPFAINSQTQYVTPRFRGRLMSIKMESADIGSFWRIGATRYRIQRDGKF